MWNHVEGLNCWPWVTFKVYAKYQHTNNVIYSYRILVMIKCSHKIPLWYVSCFFLCLPWWLHWKSCGCCMNLPPLNGDTRHQITVNFFVSQVIINFCFLLCSRHPVVKYYRSATGMVASSRTFSSHLGRYIRDLLCRWHAVLHDTEALGYSKGICSLRMSAHDQQRTLVPPLKSDAN